MKRTMPWTLAVSTFAVLVIVALRFQQATTCRLANMRSVDPRVDILLSFMGGIDEFRTVSRADEIYAWGCETEIDFPEDPSSSAHPWRLKSIRRVTNPALCTKEQQERMRSLLTCLDFYEGNRVTEQGCFIYEDPPEAKLRFSRAGSFIDIYVGRSAIYTNRGGNLLRYTRCDPLLLELIEEEVLSEPIAQSTHNG